MPSRKKFESLLSASQKIRYSPLAVLAPRFLWIETLRFSEIKIFKFS